MSPDTNNLNNQQLSRLYSEFSSIRPGYTQRVEMVYTAGKTDLRWAGAPSSGSGRTIAVTVRDKPRFLNAVVLIDLNKHIPVYPPSKTFGTPKPSFREIRRNLFESIMHELWHVVQGWNAGDEWGKVATKAASNGYQKNPLELEAERKGAEWARQHSDELAAGVYDDILPAGVTVDKR